MRVAPVIHLKSDQRQTLEKWARTQYASPFDAAC